MSIPINVEDLVNKRIVESNRIEFKEDFNPDTIIRSICAFANDIDNMGGGYIVMGVAEKDGTPVFPLKGIEQNRIDSILKKLREYCHYIEPLYEPVVEPVLYDDVYIIVIWVAGGYGRPYKAPRDVTNKQGSKYYYIRKFANSVIASPQEERELFYASSNIPFDDRPNLAAELGDLDIELMREHLKAIRSGLYPFALSMSSMDIAKNMQLVDGPPERLKPLNVAILMFSAQPEKYFKYARIELVDIPDPTGTNMTEKIFTGPIQRQLQDALLYLKNYLIKEKIVKYPDKAQAERIYNYPYAALEEILANAVYHRSYQVQEPITIRITPENIEITSFPGFDRSISDAAIAKYDIRARIYRNRRIGDFLKELRLIEGRNTGFPNAIKALKDNGSDNLSFDMGPEREYLSVIISVHPSFLPKSAGKDKKKAYIDTILEALVEEPLTLTELSLKLGYKGISSKMRNAVQELVQNKRITQIAEGRKIKFKV